MCCMVKATSCRTLMIEQSTCRSRLRIRVTVLTETHCVECCPELTRRYRVTVLTETHCVACCAELTRRYRVMVLTESHCVD